MNSLYNERVDALKDEIDDLRFAFFEDYYQMDTTDRDFNAGYIAGMQVALDVLMDRVAE